MIMKKTFITLFALIAMGGSAMAGDKPVISVADVEVMQGQTGAFSINLVDGKANTYTAVKFDAYFEQSEATGFVFNHPVWDAEKGMDVPEPIGITPANSWPAIGEVGEIDPTTQIVTITAASSSRIPSSTVDNLLTVKFQVDDAMPLSAYNVTLKNIMFEFGTEGKAYADDVTFTITVTDRVTLDETSTTIPVAESDVNVKVKREIKANSWSTICLPFAIPAEKMTAAFGAGVEVKDFTSWSSTEEGDNIVGITIGFTAVTAMEANHPYLIKVANAITAEEGFTVDGVDIAPEAEPEKVVGATKKTKGYFYGTYVANTTVPEYNLFIYNDRFYYSNGSTKMKAFRGYFELYDYLSSLDEAGARISIVDEDVTGIANVKTLSVGSSDYYDLQGRKVENPGKGLYINNGRKVVKR